MPSKSCNTLPGLAPHAMERGGDVREARAVLPADVEAFQRLDLVELPEQLAVVLVDDLALDEADRHQPLALGHRPNLVQRGRGVDDDPAGLELEQHLAA